MFKPELSVTFPGLIVPAWTEMRINDKTSNPETIVSRDIQYETPRCPKKQGNT
jgi:hypothetical protein